MKISLCMIVKNEEEVLEKCLISAAAYVDEIVIADTGSSDNTKKIAQKYTDKIYDFAWCNDFSKARNFSVSKAENDWVLVLDADESIVSWDKPLVEKHIKSNTDTVGRIKIINLIDDIGGGIKRTVDYVSRFFNKNIFHFEGIVHEQIVRKDGEPHSRKNIEISVEHIGYSDKILKSKDKIDRNIRLLQSAISLNEKDPYLYYQLGKSYYLKKEYDKTIEAFSKALDCGSDNCAGYLEDILTTYGYCLLNTGRYSEALELESYIPCFNTSPDFHFIMGLVYMNNGMFLKAVESFAACTDKNEGRVEGVNSYLAYYNIGVIYECLGYKDDAINFYKKCGNYEPALLRINKLL
ncbi:MAG TPA: glycosyltransferase [Clostridiaceae bacterium]|nr:glycosyltransferase [Clostridiaceae bacterium]